MVLALGACAGPPVEGADPCAGADAADLDIGQGDEAFAPWFAGDEIPLEQSGGYGFWITLRTRGLDTRDLLTTSLAFTVGDAPEVTEIEVLIDYGCQPDGTGNGTLFANLPDDLQSADAVEELEGEPLELVATLTDRAGDTASGDIGLTLQSRWLFGPQ